ncbi:hypothetical protein HY442_01335 [Candidatus Parcubacteria bacterium]|nr:hypothetical protein [Candidatus Parcubacteria bacterium]MBI4099155.1 hypothetical protein [Candidatus Parcubacteria bacterium]MBI4385511.1 hypothetical protein [Candidatus Parcubacteria bacterium]
MISGAFRGGEINQLISLSFTHVFSGQAEQLHLGFHEVGADLVVYLWLGPNYRKNQALWLGGQAWEKHLKQLLGERAAEVRLMDPAFWLQRQGRMVRHIQVSCN